MHFRYSVQQRTIEIRFATETMCADGTLCTTLTQCATETRCGIEIHGVTETGCVTKIYGVKLRSAVCNLEDHAYLRNGV